VATDVPDAPLLRCSIFGIHRRPPNTLPFSGVGAAKPALRFYMMSLRRPHPSATACSTAESSMRKIICRVAY
jgi:hypothetical protein